VGLIGSPSQVEIDAHALVITPAPIRVAIVEDDSQVRDSLRVLIHGAPGFCCVGTHPSAEKALLGLPDERPDVVLMDIGLPGMSGIQAVGCLKKLLPNVPVLMLTVYEDADRIFEALRGGASGYLLKRTAPAALLQAIVEIRDGGSPMSPTIARRVVRHFQDEGPSPRPPENLTPREQEILSLLAQGQLYKEIADRLDIGIETVRSHLSSIYAKLHVRSRTEAVVKFLGG
jgi:DNA-binding NarL/FixJ family response regulator